MTIAQEGVEKEDSSNGAFVEEENDLENVEDINELKESSIITKIYRSDDPALDELLDGDSNLDPTVRSDILNKEELLGESDTRVVKRTGGERGFLPDRRSPNNVIFPLLVSLVLIGFLVVIFKLLIQKKLYL